MRHTYDLTPQTTEALTDRVKAVAEEMEVNKSYLYAILSGAQTDPYPVFKHLFRSVARVHPEGARNYLKNLQACYERETHRKSKAICVDISDLSTHIGEQYMEFINSRLKGKCVSEQRKELRDIIEAACETMERLEEQVILDENTQFQSQGVQ